MAPKGKQQEPKKAKATVDDKTFGMKNKKGGQAKRQIAQLEAQAKSNKSPEEKRKEAEKAQRLKEKEAADKAKAETAELFKPVQVQKVPFGVDPKTVLCQFFKQGHCDKGKKCKFSHDLDVGRKGAKRDLYQDTREQEKEEKEKDNMDDWDEEKLRKVVMSKHGNPKTTTDKVCKYFISAVEDGKYGWFWTCPNGGDKCMYRHSLPPGFVLKTKEQRRAEKALMDKSPLNTLTLEDFLESERHKLTGTLTPVTPESFAKWKKERLDKKAAEAEALRAREATGRAMFESGDWKDSEDEDSEEDDEDDDDDDQAAWDLENLRQETERLRQLKEEERLARANGEPVPDRNDDTDSNDAESQEGSSDRDGSDDDSGEGPSGTNGESSGTKDET
ncbi:Translation machinery-associated protein 46 [Cladophialophora chaetospira]|uniref:Translation machinery-associated protein 46 n=1 Tax=Cladophialophora chaetospira TaxID=386627 RepID=A0AA38X0C4_9EURO|nr:Translation machinery-associated protein 46 [Cladophialophora chaetospira]